MAQNLPPEETERSLTAQIRVIRPIAKNNRTYQVVEFATETGVVSSVNVFNPHQLEGIEAGMTVDIGLIRKNNFWNLANIRKSDQELKTPPPPPADENRVSEGPKMASFLPSYNPKDLDPREHRIMSMNALTNAVNFVTCFRELLKPTNIDEAFAHVDYYRSLMIEMHDPNYGNNRAGESK